MSRSRIFSVLAALVAAALACAGFALIGAPANASAGHAAKKPVRPKVGQCRTTTYDQAFGNSDSHKAVPCSQPHRMKTFAVVTVPKKYNLKKPGTSTFGQYVLTTCAPRFRKALGGTYALQDQTAYTWWSFVPTKAEQKKGARWLRCDLSLLVAAPGGSSSSAALPNVAFPMVGTRPITDVTRRCLANTNNVYVTTCSRAHVARSDQTFVLNSTAYPSATTLKAAAQTNCPGKRYTSPPTFDWKHGDHVITCFTVTTS